MMPGSIGAVGRSLRPFGAPHDKPGRGPNVWIARRDAGGGENATWTWDESGGIRSIPFSLRERATRKVAHIMATRWPLDRLHMQLGKGTLSINFDDFSRTAWHEGGAVLADHGVKATYFTAGGLCGRYMDGIRTADITDIELACDSGHEIGCHSFDHFAATRCRPDLFLASIERNRRFLAEVLPGREVESFAFPYGAATTRLRRVLKRRFTSLRGTVQASNGPILDRSLLRAFGLERHRFPRSGDLERHFDPIFAAIARNRLWVVVFTHDVSDRPSEWGCTPDQLNGVLALALRRGLDVATNAEVMRRLLRANNTEQMPHPRERLLRDEAAGEEPEPQRL